MTFSLLDVSEIETLLSISFLDKNLLKTAFTHSSFARQGQSGRIEDNERLEFFGDAVVKLIVTEYLFRKFSRHNEGDLTKIRARFVSDQTLSKFAIFLDLGSHIILSYGEKLSGGHQRVSNLANVFEALLGAYYLDQGLDACRAFFNPILDRFSDDLLKEEDQFDYKTMLQEYQQRRHLPLPVYHILDETGPEHAKQFHLQVEIQRAHDTVHFVGEGISKKAAQQKAAKAALSAFGSLTHSKETP